MFDTVVLATDGSASAERAVTLALDFADRFEASLDVCYVVDESDDTDTDTLRDAGRETLADIEARTEGIDTTILSGDPAAEICAHAEAVGADLVVTGTRGRHGEHSYLLGSVAEAIVRESPAPVLTARQLDADAPKDVPVPNGAGE